MEDMITKKQHQVTSPDALRDAASTSTSGDFTAYYSFSKKGKELLSSNTEDVGTYVCYCKIIKTVIY
jgi:hypothetical protein